MSETTPTKTLVAEVAMGAHDGGLADLLDAIKLRVKGGAAAFRWKLTLVDPELVVTEDDITVGELEQIEKLTGVSWTVLNPATRASVCATILRVCLQSRTDLSADAAADVVAALTADQITEAMSEYEVPVPPLGRTSTS